MGEAPKRSECRVVLETTHSTDVLVGVGNLRNAVFDCLAVEEEQVDVVDGLHHQF